MDRFQAKEIIEKILERDYERWIEYIGNKNYVGEHKKMKASFYLYKKDKELYQRDAEDIAELLI